MFTFAESNRALLHKLFHNNPIPRHIDTFQLKSLNEVVRLTGYVGTSISHLS